MEKYLLVAAGGMIGAVGRYGLSGWIGNATSGRFPYGTLVVNIIGCLIIGFFLTLGYERFAWSPELRVFVAVGILGGFTTFSTFSFETISLLREGTYYLALFNMLASLVGCLAATFVGVVLAKQF